MRETNKLKLDPEEYSLYNIPLTVKAYTFSLDKVIEERCDEFDYYLEQAGYTIANRELIPIATSIFNYEIIAYL